MKKILLGTTTLIGAATLFAGAAFAETPKVTVGGYANFEAGYINDDLDTATGGGVSQRPQAFRSDTQVDFRIDGKNDSGLGYGGEIDILADTSGDVRNRGVNASKTFVYLEGGWGRFEMGSNVGAESTMKVDAGSIARATGGINGDWVYFANVDDQFLASSNLLLPYGAIGAGALNYTGDHSEENISKVTYYTPRFSGFQVGLSYLPDQINRGQGIAAAAPNPVGPNRTDTNVGLSDNIFTGGISYDNKFGDIGFAAAVTGEWGNAQSTAYEDLKAWNAGLKFTYMGFSLAGSYGDWGDSNTLTTDNSDDSTYWNVGGAYEYGPFGTSITYLNSTLDCGLGLAAAGPTSDCGAAGKNKLDTISLGADYKLAPGLTPYAEVTWYDQNAVTAASDNKGYVIIVGTQLNF